jgi:2-methylisocitrate lyase-like PEP mutase family enzyme
MLTGLTAKKSCSQLNRGIEMTTKTEAFVALHRSGDPIIIFNIWDAGSAAAVARAGAKAIATGSWGVAGAQGFGDGEAFPLDLAIANTRRIVAATDLPVSVDLESGYGDVRASAQSILDAGAIGINLEDRIIGETGLYSIADQSSRIVAAASTGIFVNARTDLFIKTPVDAHDAALVDQAVERAHAYAAAGAHSFFAPFLVDAGLIAMLCEKSPLPVNILVRPGCPTHVEMAKLGVARISHGHAPWAAAMEWLEGQARSAFESVDKG